ncbi:MAG TPA: NAD(P)/FAD-dependent oxidoreductase [Caulobacteraceae bacterium]|jgi:cyclohexanone monooxygenase|nr:NAD(P)/FAD-dependent oxidoreductase [Caulobacteraceae bacterium]
MTGLDPRPPVALDAVVVGAGFAGLYALHRLRELGFSARLFEKGDGVGGTWYWNRYPGARCDLESFEYQYSFSEELARAWTWTERYPTQPEILRYANFVADRLDLRPDIQLETSIVSAVFDEDRARWTVVSDRGDVVSAKFCILATGSLSASVVPDFNGLEAFEGRWHHTGRWPHEGVDFRGQRVAVIGTGSSGVQAVPVIAEQASELFVFQRTPAYSMPAGNRPLQRQAVDAYKEQFVEIKRQARATWGGAVIQLAGPSALAVPAGELEAELETRWHLGGFHLIQSYGDVGRDHAANDLVAEFVRRKIRAAVKDPEVAEVLTPRDYPFGAKRPCLDSGYYEAFNQPHVRLIDVRTAPIEAITRQGVKAGGREYAVDIIVFATGYDAMTGSMLAFDITGRQGLSLRRKWAAGPLTYLGLTVAGFPNLFIITGPGSPSVTANMIIGAELQTDWIMACLGHMREHGWDSIEPQPDAESAWVEHVNATAKRTVFYGVASWYMGANIPGKPRVFMPYLGGLNRYTDHCNAIAANGYEGFVLARAGAAAGTDEAAT